MLLKGIGKTESGGSFRRFNVLKTFFSTELLVKTFFIHVFYFFIILYILGL